MFQAESQETGVLTEKNIDVQRHKGMKPVWCIQKMPHVSVWLQRAFGSERNDKTKETLAKS